MNYSSYIYNRHKFCDLKTRPHPYFIIKVYDMGGIRVFDVIGDMFLGFRESPTAPVPGKGPFGSLISCYVRQE